jgi:hypothetical protein
MSGPGSRRQRAESAPRWRRFRGLKASILGIALPFGAALADTVVLKNGKRIDGEVSIGSAAGKTRVTLDQGVFFEFAQDEIERIEPGKSPARDFDERLARVDAGDLEALEALASWARERKLRARERIVYERILRLDPNHALSRKELGYAVYKNRWVHERDLKTRRLVEHEGEWMTPEERERRRFEKLRLEVAEDIRGADSENRFVQEYSIRRLFERKDPALAAVYLEYFDHSSPTARLVAVQALARLLKGAGAPAKTAPSDAPRADGGSAAAPAPDFEGRVARALLDRTLKEENGDVRKALNDALATLRPRRYFELALETVRRSPNPLERERAAEGAVMALSKAWVPELFDALDEAPPGVPLGGNPAVRRVLMTIFKRDFEYRVEDWRKWWAENSGNFTDED